VSSKVIRPTVWRRETGDRLKHFQIAETTARSAPDHVLSYAFRDRWHRRAHAIATVLAMAITMFVCLALGSGLVEAFIWKLS
jgi:hypothetical protein